MLVALAASMLPRTAVALARQNVMRAD